MRAPCRRMSRPAFVLLTLALTFPALARAQSATPFAPSVDQRVRLERASEDASLEGWQRDFMRDLARPPAEARSPDADDGVWSELVIGTRARHCSVYDPVRQRMVVFGGVDSSTRYLNDTWVLTLDAAPRWYRLEPTGAMPRGRANASMVYDSRYDRIVVYGGRAGAAPYYPGDVWALSLANQASWQELTPVGGARPAARVSHTAIYDPPRARMVVFGGWDTLGTRPNDVWMLALDGTPAWSQPTTAGTPPAGRVEHTAIHDPVRQRMVVYGGNTAAGNTYDVWTLSLTSTPTWALLSPSGLPPYIHSYHTAAYDPVGDRMLVYGGNGAGSWYAYVWALSLAGAPAWSMMTAVAPMPSQRIDQTAVFDVPRNRLLAFGGEVYESGGTRNDVWEFPIAAGAWGDISPTGTTPTGRTFATAVMDPPRGRMILFGGTFPTVGRLNVVNALATTEPPVWTGLMPTGTPPTPRYGACGIYDPPRERMVVYGGATGSGMFDDSNEVWALSLAGTPAWSLLAPTGTPPFGSHGATAVYDAARERMLVFGGKGWDGTFYREFNDVWALSLAAPAWTQLAPAGTLPSGRIMHSAIYDPVRDRMIVYGGNNGGARLGDVQSLTLSGTPTWSALTPTGTPPAARDGHAGIYDPVRDRMVVCAGVSSTYSSETWAMSLGATPAWSLLNPSSVPPDPRGAHTGVYDAANDRLIIFGGGSFKDDLWALRWTLPVSVEPAQGIPSTPCLRAPAPNPMHGDVTLAYALPRAGLVSLRVYDLRGRLVRTLIDGMHGAGAGSARWDGRDSGGTRVRPGVYFVRLRAPEAKGVRKVVVME